MDSRATHPIEGNHVRSRIFALAALIGVLALSVVGCSASQTPGNTSSTPTTKQISGSINISGSDTMINLAQAWAEQYQTANPQVLIAVKGGGSGTGIAALINGTVDFADASREANASEISADQAKGKTLVQTAVARDGISVIVNPGNSVSNVTTETLAKIYSGQITNWSQVPGGKNAPIVLVGRDSSSGTYTFFHDSILGTKGVYAKSMRNLQSNDGIVQEVSKDPNAIGYVGLGYAQSAGTSIKRLTLNGITDDVANVLNDTYPLARKLYMDSNDAPAGVMKEYIDWIMSAAGQKIVVSQGFVPLTK